MRSGKRHFLWRVTITPKASGYGPYRPVFDTLHEAAVVMEHPETYLPDYVSGSATASLEQREVGPWMPVELVKTPGNETAGGSLTTAPAQKCDCPLSKGNGDYIGHEHLRTCPAYPTNGEDA